MDEQISKKQDGEAAQSELSAEAYLKSLGKTESKTAGRMRLRLNPEIRTPDNYAEIKENLENHSDIDEVQINEATGSVVIKHSKNHNSHQLFWSAIKECEIITEVAFDESDEEDGHDPRQKLEQQLADVSYNIDRFIYERTGENLHLGLLIPAGIAAIGVSQIVIYGIGLDLLPGPVLLWIGYDIYRRIGKEPPFIARDKKGTTSNTDEDIIPEMELSPA